MKTYNFRFFDVFYPEFDINPTFEIAKTEIMPRRSRCLIFVKIRLNHALKMPGTRFKKKQLIMNPTNKKPTSNEPNEYIYIYI